ncbi:uncharacterized protein TNCV_4069931 [Trichonephila clavipes]|nr:uncharacterized protein TNCV_4069931 [Trichonephila clavipes]
MGVCKCVVPLRNESTLNNHRAACPLVWLVEGEQKWEAPDHLEGVLPQNSGGTELKRTVTCLVLKAKDNDNSTSAMQRQVIVTGIARNCDHVGHSTADTNGRRIVGLVQPNPVFWGYQLKRRRTVPSDAAL